MRFDISKIKNLFQSKQNHLTERQNLFIKILGYCPQNWELFELAFTLKSFTDTKVLDVRLNNERLEFLGDAVLETIVSNYLFQKYPLRSEGFLTDSRSMIVKRTTLNRLGVNLGFADLIDPSEKIQSSNSYGNIFEALIGAIFLDAGYEQANAFMVHLLETQINVERFLQKEENYKSQLIELCQKYRWIYSFELIESTRLEDNKMRFQTRVLVKGLECGLGVGNSKRMSEQNAAKHAIPVLRKWSR